MAPLCTVGAPPYDQEFGLARRNMSAASSFDALGWERGKSSVRSNSDGSDFLTSGVSFPGLESARDQGHMQRGSRARRVRRPAARQFDRRTATAFLAWKKLTVQLAAVRTHSARVLRQREPKRALWFSMRLWGCFVREEREMWIGIQRALRHCTRRVCRVALAVWRLSTRGPGARSHGSHGRPLVHVGIQHLAAGAAGLGHAAGRTAFLHRKQVVKQHAALRRTVIFLLRRKVERSFRRWKQRAARLRVVRRRLTHLRCRRTARPCFQHWQTHCRARLHMTVRVIQMLRRRARRLHHDALIKWSVEAKRRYRVSVQVKQMLGRMLSRGLAHAVVHWRDRYRSQKALKKRVIWTFYNIKVASAFRKWTEATQKCRRAAVVMRKIVGRLSQRSLGSAFDGWAQKVTDEKRVQGAARKVMARLLQRSQAMAFARWSEAACTQKRMAFVMGRIVQRFMQRAVASAFVGCSVERSG